jgi:hypothetical protein
MHAFQGSCFSFAEYIPAALPKSIIHSCIVITFLVAWLPSDGAYAPGSWSYTGASYNALLPRATHIAFVRQFQVYTALKQDTELCRCCRVALRQPGQRDLWWSLAWYETSDHPVKYSMVV